MHSDLLLHSDALFKNKKQGLSYSKNRNLCSILQLKFSSAVREKLIELQDKYLPLKPVVQEQV